MENVFITKKSDINIMLGKFIAENYGYFFLGNFFYVSMLVTAVAFDGSAGALGETELSLTTMLRARAWLKMLMGLSS